MARVCVCVHMGITVAVKRAPLRLVWCGRVYSVLCVQYAMHRNSLEHTTVVHKPSTTYAMHRNGSEPFHNVSALYRNALQGPQWPESLPQHFGSALQCTIRHHKLPQWSASFLQCVSGALQRTYGTAMVQKPSETFLQCYATHRTAM